MFKVDGLLPCLVHLRVIEVTHGGLRLVFHEPAEALHLARAFRPASVDVHLQVAAA